MNELSPGRDLWVVPDREHSDWCVALDWYLQFQISRAWARRPMQVAPHLKELARHAEVEPAPEPAPDTIRSKALLISTHALLPNRETLHIPYRNNINDWLEELNAIWVDLKQPTLRVFLPRGVRPEHFHGSKLQITKHAEFVVDGRPWN